MNINNERDVALYPAEKDVFFSVNSIHGNVAVLVQDDSKLLQMDASQLPYATVEGDVVEWWAGTYIYARKETQRRRDKTKSLLNRVLKNE